MRLRAFAIGGTEIRSRTVDHSAGILVEAFQMLRARAIAVRRTLIVARSCSDDALIVAAFEMFVG